MDEKLCQLVVFKSKPVAVQPNKICAFRSHGHNLRYLRFEKRNCEVNVSFYIVKNLLKPLITVSKSSLHRYQPENTRGTHQTPSCPIELLTQFLIRYDGNRCMKPRNVKCLTWSKTSYGVHREFFFYRSKRCMLGTFQQKFTMNLIANHYSAGAYDNVPDFKKFIHGPYPAAWIMGTAQDHGLCTIHIKTSPEIVKVNLILLVTKPELINSWLAIIVPYGRPKRRIDRTL